MEVQAQQGRRTSSARFFPAGLPNYALLVLPGPLGGVEGLVLDLGKESAGLSRCY